MNALTQALNETVEALSQSDGDHAASVGTALVRLREVARSPEGSDVRATALTVADSIEQSLEKIRKQHQFTISQFHSEIRLLHNRIDSLETGAATDETTRFNNRRSISEYIRALRPGGASVLLLKAQGLAHARATEGPSVADDLGGILSRRLRNSLPKGAIVGRWSEQDFVVILPAGQPAEEVSVQAISTHLSMPYACMQNGKVIRLAVNVSAEYLAGIAANSPDQILARVAEAFGP
jgi:GGDEF domain-containing protein